MNIIWIFALTTLSSAVGLVLLVGLITNSRHPKPGRGPIGDDNWSPRYRGPEKTRTASDYVKFLLGKS